MKIVGADADRIHNDMYSQWAETHQVDPAEDPDFLRAYRQAIGQDPETRLYLDAGENTDERQRNDNAEDSGMRDRLVWGEGMVLVPPGTPRPPLRQLPDIPEEEPAD
ncbi:hypothetical protein [Sphaerisporangium sp. NPDC051011]|uniref:hypothetical protein n=1 Tax=Sphaerisporangium sp. NPDC051011 TaxID=3155792 RepID=UPI0033DD6B85